MLQEKERGLGFYRSDHTKKLPFSPRRVQGKNRDGVFKLLGKNGGKCGRAGWSYAVSHFSEQKGEGGFLTLALEVHEAQIEVNIIGPPFLLKMNIIHH